MKLVSFQVTKFRNIVDSGEIELADPVTCLVGKNEAGKSALLEALYLANPAYDDSFVVEEQYPRWLVVQDRRAGEPGEHAPIALTCEIEPDERTAIEEAVGKKVLAGDRVIVKRRYDGKLRWSFDWDEAAAVKHLIGAFPASIAKQVSGAKSMDDVRKTIASLSKATDESVGAEDLGLAKQVIEERGLAQGNAGGRIVGILTGRLPSFFLFTKYSTLAGRIDFQVLAKGDGEHAGPATNHLQTARALLRLAGTNLKDLGEEEYERRKGELEAVQIALTNEVFEYWKQNPHLAVEIDVDKKTETRPDGNHAVARFLDIRLQDRRTGYSNNFEQRSSGFQWFFSFLAAFSEFEEGEKTPIILLDEPGLTLHGRAQADFLRFIDERLAPRSPVVYTTHSPFMIGDLECVRVVEDHGPPKGATCSQDVLASDPDSLFPLQAALGYDIAQNLFVGPHNLVVEGTSDFIYLTVMSALCEATGRESLDPRWRILPAGGATNIPTFVSLVGPHLDITVLADTDTKGMKRVENMIDQQLLKQHRLVLVSAATTNHAADIEDLFTEGDYLQLYNKTFGSSLKTSDLPKGKRIVKRIEEHAAKFAHGRVAETLLRDHQKISFSDTSLDRFAELNRVLNATIET